MNNCFPPPHTHVGKVVGVDEDNAYSWPACDLCGNEQLSENERYVDCAYHVHRNWPCKYFNVVNLPINTTFLGALAPLSFYTSRFNKRLVS